MLKNFFVVIRVLLRTAELILASIGKYLVLKKKNENSQIIYGDNFLLSFLLCSLQVHIQGASGIVARFLNQKLTFIKYLKITTD
jgi:hypothetical protein